MSGSSTLRGWARVRYVVWQSAAGSFLASMRLFLGSPVERLHVVLERWYLTMISVSLHPRINKSWGPAAQGRSKDFGKVRDHASPAVVEVASSVVAMEWLPR